MSFPSSYSRRPITKAGLIIFLCVLMLPNNVLAERNSGSVVIDGEAQKKLYLNELSEKVQVNKLYEHPTWRALIHYKRNDFLHGFTSQVDDPAFFLSINGKTDPKAEMAATLAAFFSRDSLPSTSLSPQCRFVARFYWLNQMLGFDPEKLPIESCAKYEDFKKALNVESITVIFPSTHPNSPASMYGHTSMLLDKKSQTAQTRMLSYTVNYAAQAEEVKGATYAIKGLMGGFKGQYNIVPYYAKQREWAQLENRDIWEYKLNLSVDKVDFILMHAYELSMTYFDYFFFKENCSYHLLSLIEVSMPDTGLTDSFTGWTLPVDTIRALDKQGQITGVTYHPSLSTIIEHKRSSLTSDEKAFALQLFRDGLSSHIHDLNSHPAERQAMILDLTYEYLRYNKVAKSEIYVVKLETREREILLARSKLPVISDPDSIKIPETRPDQGHDTARLTVGAGSWHHDPFIELGWRATYHDLLDPVAGYAPHSQLEFFNIRGRYYRDNEKLEIHSLKLVDIISLEVSDNFFRNFSWHINTGWLSVPKKNRDDFANYYTINGGGGITNVLNFRNQTVMYSFIDSQINYGKTFDAGYTFGAGVTVGILSEITSNWKMHLFGSYISGIAGDGSNTKRFSLEQGINLARNFSLRLSTSRHEMLGIRSSEVLAQLHVYY